MREEDELRNRLSRLQKSSAPDSDGGTQSMQERLEALSGFGGDSVGAEGDYNSRLAKLTADEGHRRETSEAELAGRFNRLGLAVPTAGYHVPEVRLHCTG